MFRKEAEFTVHRRSSEIGPTVGFVRGAVDIAPPIRIIYATILWLCHIRDSMMTCERLASVFIAWAVSDRCLTSAAFIYDRNRPEQESGKVTLWWCRLPAENSAQACTGRCCHAWMIFLTKADAAASCKLKKVSFLLETEARIVKLELQPSWQLELSVTTACLPSMPKDAAHCQLPAAPQNDGEAVFADDVAYHDTCLFRSLRVNTVAQSP